jgi:hypothetical protein
MSSVQYDVPGDQRHAVEDDGQQPYRRSAEDVDGHERRDPWG